MRRLVTCLSVLACCLGLLAAAPASGAAPEPSITLTSAPTRISATHTLGFGYSVANLRNSHVDLELLEHGQWTSTATATGQGRRRQFTYDDHIQTFASPSTGKHFAVTVTQNDGELFMLWNGSASCYSANGKA